MERAKQSVWLDRDGQLLDTRIARVLTRLLPRLRREFPALQDEVAMTEVMEEAGQRIVHREGRSGRIEKLHGYAWVTVRSVATSRMRRGSTRLIQKTLESQTSQVVLASARAVNGSAEEIERDILLREVLGKLSREERLVCVWKRAGFSSQEIAKHQKRSVAAVDTLFSRAKQKLRRLLGVLETGNCERCSSRNSHIQQPRPRDEEDTEIDDGKTGFAKDNDDASFRDDIDEVLSRANPNLERIGCPSTEALIELSRRELPLGDPAYEHLLKCSPCYRTYRALRYG